LWAAFYLVPLISDISSNCNSRLFQRLTPHGLPLTGLSHINNDMKETKVFPIDAAMLLEDGSSREALPLYLSPVAAGFPSPAEDYLDRKLDLHDHLVRNHAATFFLRASGDSMIRAGILDGDLLVVDRSLAAGNGSVVIAAVEGELTVKYLANKNGRVLLVPANEEYPELDITDQEDAMIWGVVTYAIHKLNGSPLGAR
jgi:DNA polymerase V